jgi:hypothetical protein
VMARRPQNVVYVGSARTAAEAFPCSSCYADIGKPRSWNRHTGPIPHQCRIDLADAIGLRDSAPAPLLKALA